MKRIVATLAFVLVAPGLVRAESNKPLLLRTPTVNRTHIVFAYGDDLWSVPRAGGAATRQDLVVTVQ